MGKGLYALNLAGDCIEKPLGQDANLRNCQPFREFCIHLTLAEIPGFGNGSDTGTFACGKRQTNAAEGTNPLPQFSTVANEPRGIRYGATKTPVELNSLDGPVWFDHADLQPWRKRDIYPERRTYAQGPPVKYAHLAREVRRRLKTTAVPNNSSYADRLEFNFTDSETPLRGETDWMGPIHPAGYFWTDKGIPEPFKAHTHYEQSGATPSAGSYSQGWIPFCSPMPVRDQAGAILGHYEGYTVLHYASAAYLKNPIKVCSVFPCQSVPSCGATDRDGCQADGFLPPDYYEPPNPVTGKQPPVRPTNQFLQVDTHFFLAGSGAADSPKIGSARHWFYNRPDRSAGDPCNPYLYTLYGTLQSHWAFPVKFRVIGHPEETITFDLSSLRVYVTP